MTEASPWLVCFDRLAKPLVRLFCFPYAGGGAAMYRPWRTALPAGVELWAVRLPGRETRFRERPFHRLGPLIDALEAEFATWRDVPFAIFGHSLGAITGFELARRLEATPGGSPRHVFVSAHRAPHVRQTAVMVHLAPDEVILQRMRTFGGTPHAFYEQPELVAAMLPNLRADVAVSETYRYEDQTPLRATLSAFGGVDDDVALEGSIAPWGDVAGGPFRHRMFPGGHFYWMADSATLLAEISADLHTSFPELLGAADSG